MSPEWVTAIATIITAAVIAASAGAALVQLRHMRGSNQIAALTECRETLESKAFRDAQRFVSYELPKRLTDPVQAAAAVEIPFKGEYESIGTVANFFEHMGSLVKHQIIDKRIVCDMWAYMVLHTWNAVLPVTTYLRTTYISAVWENFEYLAAESEAHIRKVEKKSLYPRKTPRMREDRSLVETLGTAARDLG